LACLQFSYHMYGSGVGSLAVILADSAGTRPQWSVKGTKGTRWIFRQEIVTMTRDTQVTENEFW
jgi:hypothetical protein